MKNKFLITFISLLLISCSSLTGEEVARLSFDEISTDDNLIIKEAEIDLLKGDEIYLWSQMNFEHTDNIELRFRIEILKNGEKYGGLEIDPTDKNITIGEMKSTINNKTKWRFSGKNSEIKIKEDGKYTFKAILVTSENPSLKINKADLIIKM